MDIVENPVIKHKKGKSATYSNYALLKYSPSVIHNEEVLTKVK